MRLTLSDVCVQETVSSLSKSTLVDFIKGNFLGSRMAVAGTGAVSADALVRFFFFSTPISKHNPHHFSKIASTRWINPGALVVLLKAHFLFPLSACVMGPQASSVGSWAVPSSGHGVDAALTPTIFTGSDIRARFDAYPVRPQSRSKGRQIRGASERDNTLVSFASC